MTLPIVKAVLLFNCIVLGNVVFLLSVCMAYLDAGVCFTGEDLCTCGSRGV